MQELARITDGQFGFSRQSDLLGPFDFELLPGFSVVLGENGAGKSTLMKILAGELQLRRGNIHVLGSDPKSVSPAKQRIGWVPQRNVFDPNQKLRHFVASVAWLRGASRSRAATDAAEALAMVKLTEHSEKKMKELSGGMQRRALIASGIVNHPEVLLLDEPTAGLDPANRQEVMRLIVGRGAANVGVLMTTHLPADVVEADRVAFLSGGSLSAFVSPEELVERWGSIEQAFYRFCGDSVA